jgi:mono/diheme cytochrome c family protein
MRREGTTRMMQRTAGLVLAVTFGVTAVAAAQAPDPKLVDQGKKLYVSEKCDKCHNIDGKGAKKGPLDGVGKARTKAQIREWFTNTEALEQKLEKPPTGTNRMSNALKTKKLTDPEIDALVAYLQTLTKGEFKGSK